MKADENAVSRPDRPSGRWPEPLTLAEWDRRFPGIFDGVAIMGGAANIILQLARRGVGYGVVESRVESGQLFKHPVKRARTTFTYLAVATLGTTEEKLAYRKAVTKAHAQVRSTETSPVKYSGLDPELQLWVAACLYFGFVDTWGKLRGAPDAATAEALYRELEPLATTLQVPPSSWPADLEAFQKYWERGLEELQIDDAVRSYLAAIVDLKFLHPALRGLAPLHRFLTAGFLPPRVREQMGLEWGPSQQRRFEQVLAVVAAFNNRLPRIVRQGAVELTMRDFRSRLRNGAPLV